MSVRKGAVTAAQEAGHEDRNVAGRPHDRGSHRCRLDMAAGREGAPDQQRSISVGPAGILTGPGPAQILMVAEVR